MKRKLPEVMIENTVFFVDVLNDTICEKANPENKIPFSAFDQEGEGYTFLYDTQRKNIPSRSIKHMEPHFKWVTIPALMELDPEGIALKYDIPLEILLPDRTDLRTINLDDDDEDEIEQEYF